MTNQKKILAVIGATGAQGGGLVRAVLDDADSAFRVRAITRNAGSDAAKALAARGAQVVEANLDDEASLRAAFAGSHGVYAVTNFWEHFSVETELAQAKNIANAAKAASVRHLIWSTLDDTRNKVPLDDDRMPTLMEHYKVPHFDGKGEADALFTAAGVPTTFLLTAFYWDNLIHFGMGPRRNEDGALGFVLPMDDAKLPGMAVEDIGRCAYGIFKAGESMIGRTVGIAGEHLSGAEMAAKLGEAIGETVSHVPVPPDVYRTFGFPGAEDLGNMFQYKRDFEEDYRASRPVEFARQLNPALQSFSEWLDVNASRIAIQ